MDERIAAQDFRVARRPVHVLGLDVYEWADAEVHRSIVSESHGNATKIGRVGQGDLGDRFANKLRVLVDRVGHDYRLPFRF